MVGTAIFRRWPPQKALKRPVGASHFAIFSVPRVLHLVCGAVSAGLPLLWELFETRILDNAPSF